MISKKSQQQLFSRLAIILLENIITIWKLDRIKIRDFNIIKKTHNWNLNYHLLSFTKKKCIL